MKRLLAVLFLSLSLSACAVDSQNTYGWQDVGHETSVEFGRIVAARPVKIQGQNTGTGAAVGMGAGALAGNGIGDGNGQVAAIIGGALLGAIVGGVAEQQAQNRRGIEYTITKRSGKTVTIVQNIAKDDEPLHRGQRVIIQTSGNYMRVLPADQLPTSIKKPADISVHD
jgi:outer membrane lipoprotein SlyB